MQTKALVALARAFPGGSIQSLWSSLASLDKSNPCWESCTLDMIWNESVKLDLAKASLQPACFLNVPNQAGMLQRLILTQASPDSSLWPCDLPLRKVEARGWPKDIPWSAATRADETGCSAGGYHLPIVHKAKHRHAKKVPLPSPWTSSCLEKGRLSSSLDTYEIITTKLASVLMSFHRFSRANSRALRRMNGELTSQWVFSRRISTINWWERLSQPYI